MIDVPAQNSSLCFQFSYKKSFLYLLLIIGLLFLISGFFSLIVIFMLKPRRPIFSFQTVDTVLYKLDVSESSALFVSLAASATLITQNPNRVGITYDFSRLHILYEGLVVGMIWIPEFYQPARSHNVSVEIDIFFQHLDVTNIVSGVETNNYTIKVLGDIGVHLRVLQFKLPNIKVCLDCDVAVDGRYLTSTNLISRLRAVKDHMAHFDADSQAFSKKCSISFYL